MADDVSTPTYSIFWLYRLDPVWRRLPREEQIGGKAEFLSALETRDPRIVLRGAYSLVGLRNDADLMFWVHGPDLDALQRLAVDLAHTGLGVYLSSAYTYVGAVSQARYDPEHKPAFLRGAEPRNYCSVYPFVKTPEWYVLPYERRRELMAVHGRLGRRYSVPRPLPAQEGNGAGEGTHAATATLTAESAAGGTILTNTVDAFGLGDYEFIVAFESGDPVEICRMVEDLRSAEVRLYTKLDTPIFLGRLREPAEALADL